MTRAPLEAHSCAKDAAIEDFPSFGRDEVRPMTLLDLATLLRSMPIFTARIASAKRVSGERIMYPNRPRFCGIFLQVAISEVDVMLADGTSVSGLINGTRAKHSVFNSASTCLVVRNTRSDISRNAARDRKSTRLN